mmetsp:Transcript_35329/g.80716  ORF Transcript_35329/g.80716 Transcript_35329/m.80716 type:complete len:501 (-) Transcript_35329:327-1829(-)
MSLASDYLGLVLILGLGYIGARLTTLLHLPSVLGLLVVGVVLNVSGLLGSSFLSQSYASQEIRNLAFLIVLIRAGLGISWNDLKRGGFTTFRLGFIPVLFEAFGAAVVGYTYLGFEPYIAAMLGLSVASLSPALVLPLMMEFKEEERGPTPTLVLTAAPLEVVLVTTLHSVFLGLETATGSLAFSLGMLPVKILGGLAVGAACGWLVCMFRRYKGSVKALRLLGVGTGDSPVRAREDLLVTVVATLGATSICKSLELSYVLAVLALGFMLSLLSTDGCSELKQQLTTLWYLGEVFLFVLIGAQLQLTTLTDAGPSILLVLVIGTAFRSLGVMAALVGLRMPWAQQVFCYFAMLPKATVQAAIGGNMAAENVAHGNYVLTAAVLAVAVFAPLGVVVTKASVARLVGLPGDGSETAVTVMNSELDDFAPKSPQYDCQDQTQRKQERAGPSQGQDQTNGQHQGQDHGQLQRKPSSHGQGQGQAELQWSRELQIVPPWWTPSEG